jgi:hypothetical protein
LTESLGPEERLRKYKDYLASLSQVHQTGPTQSEGLGKGVNTLSSNTATHRQHEASLVDFKKAFSTLVSTSKEKNAESNKSKAVLLRMRSRAIDSAIQEVRHKKMLLEHKLERKAISRDQYEVELALLVSEGKSLLREKEEIARQQKTGS